MSVDDLKTMSGAGDTSIRKTLKELEDEGIIISKVGKEIKQAGLPLLSADENLRHDKKFYQLSGNADEAMDEAFENF